MHIVGQHPFYQTTEEDRLLIRKELGFKDSILQEDIDAIIEWFQKQPHLAHAPIDRDYVEKILISTKGSQEKAKRKIDNFYKYRSLAPELVQQRIQDLDDPNYDPWITYRQAAMLKLYNGKRISVFKLTEPNASKVIIDVMLKNTVMLGDLRLKYDYMLGDIWIFDLQNASIGHLLQFNLLTFQKFVNIIQDGVGFRIYEIHVINATSFSQAFLNFVKQFVKPKIVGRMVVHRTIEELQAHIPKTYLPKDYGGEQPSLDEFKELYLREIRKGPTKDCLIEYCQLISDEKNRPGDFEEEYLVGSFKKLEFD
ncbi:unnamed protein product, partial [Brenthis ino]